MLRLFVTSCVLSMLVYNTNAHAGNLVLIRHGNSQHNLAHEYNSNPEHPNYKVSCLTPLGVKQAVNTAKKLLAEGYSNNNIAEVVISPLPRTRQTANVLIEQGLFTPDKIRVDERLIEPNAGDREGLSFDLFNEDTWERHDAKQYAGETNSEVKTRIVSAYRDSAEVFGHADKHVLYITHGMPAYELVNHIKGERIRMQTAETMVLPLRDSTT